MKIIDININTPLIKLEQFIKFAGLCNTGGHAKIIIQEGNVLVNGLICEMRGKKLYDGDTVSVKDDENTYKVIINDS